MTDTDTVKAKIARYGLDPEHCKPAGKGAFGHVFRLCHDPKKRIAVKLIQYDPELSDDDNKKVARTEYELASIMAQIDVGPKVHSVRFDPEEKTALISMELMDIDLNEYFKTMGPSITEDILNDISERLERVLRRMARAGFRCLDLKPSNVMLNLDLDDEQVKITKLRVIDFDTRYCSQDKTYKDNESFTVDAMKVMLASVTLQTNKTLLFVNDLATMDPKIAKDLASDDRFVAIAKHYLKCTMDLMPVRECIQRKLDLVLARARTDSTSSGTESVSKRARRL